MFPLNTKILVVDDMPGMRAMVRGILRQMGYKDITECENGKQAFETVLAALQNKSPFELILSDWNMPVGTGIEFLKNVRTTPELEKLPFILVTAEGQFHQVKDAMKLKVSDYLVKPFTPAGFKQKLEVVWKRIHSPPPPVATAAQAAAAGAQKTGTDPQDPKKPG